MTEFATGLMIGGVTESAEAVQKRKARYRQDLLEQIAEQRRNKKKEKELELKVAATGAIDPEKEPDRIKQFGFVRREHEGRRRDVLFTKGTGIRNSDIAAFSENFHKDLSGAIGEMVPHRPSSHHSISSPEIGAYPSDRHVESYRDALKQQIEERQERSRWEWEDNERYKPKFEAEMKAYELWGRGGAGSRFRDDRGNLINGPSEVYQSPYFPARAHYSALHYSSVAEQKEREELEFMRNARLQHQPEPAAQANKRHRNLQHKPDRQLSQHGIYSSGIGSYPSDSHHCPKEHVENYRNELKQQAKLKEEMTAYERGGEETWAPLMDDQGNLIISSFAQPSPHAQAKFTKLQMLHHLLDQERDRESLKQQGKTDRGEANDDGREERAAETRDEAKSEVTPTKRQFEEMNRRKERYRDSLEKQKKVRNQELIWPAEKRLREPEKKRKEKEKKANVGKAWLKRASLIIGTLIGWYLLGDLLLY